MSKASRMFRSQVEPGGPNPAIRPERRTETSQHSSEADLSACLAALYNSPAGTSPHDFAAETISDDDLATRSSARVAVSRS